MQFRQITFCVRPSTLMAATHPSRIFANGTATTLYVTIPAEVVSDSQFPFDVDDDVIITIDGNRLVVTNNAEETDR